MKILFILDKLRHDSGGAMIDNRNLFLFQETYGKENVIVFEIQKNIKSTCIISSKLLSLNGGVSNSLIKELLIIIKTSNIKVSFISNSIHGLISKKLKKTLKEKHLIITFFHNVEYLYFKDSIKIEKVKFPLLNLFFIKKNELFSIKYSDIIIALNRRDSNNLSKIYGRESDFILPTSLKDNNNCQIELVKENYFEKKTELLFVGSDFYANIHGIQWFIDNVINKVNNANLTIVGNGIQNKINCDLVNVNIHGRVENLVDFYSNSDIVILPIFLGSGMKTKTAEALMYGKPILATKEALEGYEIENNNLIGAKCDSDVDFINKINFLGSNKNILVSMGINSRKLFEKKYSNDVILKDFKLTIKSKIEKLIQ